MLGFEAVPRNAEPVLANSRDFLGAVGALSAPVLGNVGAIDRQSPGANSYMCL
jgi:hypothetical protein